MPQLDHKLYRRTFRRALQTGHGEWAEREGIILRLRRDDGTVGYGEIAPLPWFGTETLEHALQFLQGGGGTLPTAVPPGLPCTRFALDCALGALDNAPAKRFHVAGLLPAGKDALPAAERLLAEGYTTLKWKIGVQPMEVEQRVATQLFRLLHGHGILRLDANGALTPDEADSWAHFLNEMPVEYLEQPLPKGEEVAMAHIAREHAVPIALDESLCGADALEATLSGFPACVAILKPAFVGGVASYLKWRSGHRQARVVYSSAFETAIGVEAALSLAAVDEHCAEAVGLGTLAAFTDDGLGHHKPGPILKSGTLTPEHAEALWKRL